MDIKVTIYEDRGKGFNSVHESVFNDAETKIMVADLKSDGFIRVRGSGIIGMTFEKHDLEKNTQITFERVVD